jgi:hypothetical protein
MEETVSTMLPTGDPQAVGSAITYLRRYALQSVAGVAPDDDDAEGAQQGPGGPRNSDRPAQARPAFVPVGTAQPTAQAAPGTTTVQNVTQKKGASAKGPWTRYFVKFADGREGVTFSATLGTEAEVAQQSGAPVNPEIVKTDKGSDLKGWQPVAITSAPAPEPHVPDEPVDGPEKVLTVREIKTDRGSRWVIQTAKRQLITDKHEHAEMAVEARGAGIGIVPTYDVVASPSGGAPANRLTSLLCEVAPPAEREPGAEG